MNVLNKLWHSKLLVKLMAAVLLTLPRFAMSEATIKMIHSDRVAHSEFAKQVGINQSTLRWPLTRCPKLVSAATKAILRTNIELVIICNALKNDGFQGDIEIIPAGNSQRQKIELAKGHADLIGHSLFGESLTSTTSPASSHFLQTQAVIQQGQFNVGIFTSPNQLVKVAKALRDNQLDTLTATTVSAWQLDVKTLQSLGLKSLHLLPHYQLLSANLARKRANFTLLSLGSSTGNKGLLQRVDGFKVSLNDERVFVVNKSRPDIYTALQNYIIYLRAQDDALTQAYRHAGFISDEYQQWKQIN